MFTQHKSAGGLINLPAIQVWRDMPWRILRTSLVNAMFGGVFFLSFVFGTSYMKAVGFSPERAEAIGLITAADILNDRVIPFFDAHDVHIDRMLTDRGTEYCGAHDRHEYELYLAIEDIDHTRTRTKSPQTNGICERFHKTLLDEFYRVAFRKKLYDTVEALQHDLDAWVATYNEQRTHQGRWCFGKTPMQTFRDTIHVAHEKQTLAHAA